jgi:hypothetical protein
MTPATAAALGVLNPASVKPSAWLMFFALPGFVEPTEPRL